MSAFLKPVRNNTIISCITQNGHICIIICGYDLLFYKFNRVCNCRKTALVIIILCSCAVIIYNRIIIRIKDILNSIACQFNCGSIIPFSDFICFYDHDSCQFFITRYFFNLILFQIRVM